MRNEIQQNAVLANPRMPHSAPDFLDISSRFQGCVDAGAASASNFIGEKTRIDLHNHIAASMHAFLCSVRVTGPARAERSDLATATVQEFTDAFAAGYLGRIQQELRRRHAANLCTCRNEAVGPPGSIAMH